MSNQLSPEEKANNIFIKFLGCQPVKTQGTTTVRLLPPDKELAKRCALIAVEEIMDAIRVFHNGAEWQLHETMGWQYWTLVKTKIELL